VSQTVSRDANIGLPITTGRICCIAPSMIIVKNPSVMQCVAASNAGECILAKGLSARNISISAASSRNSGAAVKNRNGTDIGGACSVLREMIFTRCG